MPKKIANEIETLYGILYNEVSLIRYGEKLPAYREMLQKYGCSRQVLTKTLDKLRQDGIIRAEDRVGMFSNVKSNHKRKNIIFVHVDWVCEHIKYFAGELEKHFSQKADCNFQKMTFEPGDIEAFIEKLKNCDADLIILTLEDFNFEVFRHLEGISDRLIFFMSSPMMEKINAIDLQPYMVGMVAAQHLVSLGHREIALVISEPKFFTSREHIYGFLDYLKMQNIRPRIIDCKVQSGYSSAGVTLDFMNDYLKRNPVDFTACFALSDGTAAAIADALRNRNIKVPDDVSIIGYGGTSIAADSKYDLCSVSFDFPKVIQTTIKSIEQFLETGKCGAKRVSPVLIRRSSVRAVIQETKQ